jgi:hypothetical protein
MSDESINLTIVKDDNGITTTIETKKTLTWKKILLKSLDLFLKTYAIRIVYSLFNLIKKKGLKSLNLYSILSSILTMSNLRTCLCVSLLPLLFRIFQKLLHLVNNKNNSLNTFISGFLAALISISIEEPTSLTKFIILSVMVRSLHSLVVVLMNKYNIFQNTGRLWDFTTYLIAALGVYAVYYLNPSYEPMQKMFNTYANYVDVNEAIEADHYVQLTGIV